MSILPSDTPRLPKWPFLIGAAALLGAATFLAQRNPAPYPAPIAIAIAGGIALATILLAIPFLSDYAAKQDEALDERQRGLEALTRTIADSAEQISVAATSLHEVSELSRKQLSQAESSPSDLQDTLFEIGRQQTEATAAASTALQGEIKAMRAAESGKLNDAVEGIHRALEALAKLKGATPKPVRQPPPPASTQSNPAVTTTVPAPAPANAPETTVTEVSAPPVVKTIDAAPQPEVTIEVATPEPEPKSAPQPKAKAAEKPPKKAEPAADPDDELLSLDALDQPARSRKLTTDGTTRLLVSAYIGIGNRLFIRGSGPGLSADKGVPLQFVSIGKWQWEATSVAEPITFRLFKNDEVECTSLGEVTLDPQSSLEVSASF